VTKREQFSSEFFPMKVRKRERETDLLFFEQTSFRRDHTITHGQDKLSKKEIDKKKETQNEKKLTLTGANGQTHFFKIRPRNW
jgi:hypothetical protein